MNYILLVFIGWVILAGLLMFWLYNFFNKKYKLKYLFDSLFKGELNRNEILFLILYIFLQILLLIITGVVFALLFMFGAVA